MGTLEVLGAMLHSTVLGDVTCALEGLLQGWSRIASTCDVFGTVDAAVKRLVLTATLATLA